MILVAVLQGRPPDGRGNTGFYEIVRLGEADKKSIADRGYTVVDLNDATAEPAVFAFILFCRDAVDIWLAALRLADELLHGLCQIRVLAAYERSLHAGVRLGQLVGIDGETRFVKADAAFREAGDAHSRNNV